MNRDYKELDFIKNKNGTIARIMRLDNYDGKVKLRKVSSCKGEFTKNIGTPYTFQDATTINAIKRNWKLISTEDILIKLFENKKEIKKDSTIDNLEYRDYMPRIRQEREFINYLRRSRHCQKMGIITIPNFNKVVMIKDKIDLRLFANDLGFDLVKQPKKNIKKVFQLLGLYLLFCILLGLLIALVGIFSWQLYIICYGIGLVIGWEIFVKPTWRFATGK